MAFHNTSFRMGGSSDLAFGNPSATNHSVIVTGGPQVNGHIVKINGDGTLPETAKFSLESDVNVPILGVMKVKTLLLVGIGLWFIFGMR